MRARAFHKRVASSGLSVRAKDAVYTANRRGAFQLNSMGVKPGQFQHRLMTLRGGLT
jgi:hypothetical protein